MADVDSRLAVDKLGVDNYATWSIKMKYLLIHRGMWKPISGEGGAALDEKALALIMLSVRDYHLSALADCETAKEAWDKLAATHKAKSIARRTMLRKELTSLKMDEDELLAMYVARATSIQDLLIAAGYAVREDEIVLAVLAGLPKQYDMVITVLESSDGELHLDEVLPKLMNVEQRNPVREAGEKAFFAQGRTRNEGSNRNSRECWYCGKTGHIRANCQKKAQDEGRSGKTALRAIAL
jgi:hypothetical protein